MLKLIRLFGVGHPHHLLMRSRASFKNWVAAGIDMNTFSFNVTGTSFDYFKNAPSNCTTRKFLP